MAAVECITRKWGSSLGIIIPKDFVEKENITENEKISLELKKVNTVKELFGLLGDWKKSTDQIKTEMKEGWD